MATNNMKLIKEAIQETTETYVDQYMKNATFVKTEYFDFSGLLNLLPVIPLISGLSYFVIVSNKWYAEL